MAGLDRNRASDFIGMLQQIGNKVCASLAQLGGCPVVVVVGCVCVRVCMCVCACVSV
jgi:hypothetical protein